jgi:hypothetical protein
MTIAVLLSVASSARAGVIRISAPNRPAAKATMLASLGVARASDGVVVGGRDLRSSQSVTLPAGVYVVFGSAAPWRRAPLVATVGVVAQRRSVRVALHLHRDRPGIAAAARGSRPADAPVITAQGVVIDGSGGQPSIPLDGVLDGYLFSAFEGEGVRVVDQTPQFTAAAVEEEVLSHEGRLAIPFAYNPLKATHFVRGEGRIRNGRADINLRLVDDSGAIIATASAHGKARDLRDVVVKAVRELGAGARGKLRPAPPATCEMAGTPGCYGVRVTVEGLFDQTGGWGSGSVTAGAGHGGSINEGFNPVEHGSFSAWPAGTSFPLYAAAHTGSQFDHWSGSCAGASPVCTLRFAPNLDTTAFFAEDLWTLTVVNKNPSGGEAAGQSIGCGIRENSCSRTLSGQTSATDFFHLYIYPEASHLVSQLDGCDEFVGTPQEGGDCRIAATANKTITVDFACNPAATSPCDGQPAAADLPRARH